MGDETEGSFQSHCTPGLCRPAEHSPSSLRLAAPRPHPVTAGELGAQGSQGKDFSLSVSAPSFTLHASAHAFSSDYCGSTLSPAQFWVLRPRQGQTFPAGLGPAWGSLQSPW